jgi:hypothetical protein
MEWIVEFSGEFEREFKAFEEEVQNGLFAQAKLLE